MTVHHQRATVVRTSGPSQPRPTRWDRSFFNAPVIKTGFLNIAALRGSAFHPLAARPFLSPLHHPCRAANLIIPLHRHTQAPNIIHLAPSNFSSPQIPTLRELPPSLLAGRMALCSSLLVRSVHQRQTWVDHRLPFVAHRTQSHACACTWCW
jgi:hypothetical protein